MATKFSAFNTETTLSSITGLVGYISGSPGSNVKISPADLISGIPDPPETGSIRFICISDDGKHSPF